MNEKNIPKNLVALIKIFQEMPELFAKKMLEHHALQMVDLLERIASSLEALELIFKNKD